MTEILKTNKYQTPITGDEGYFVYRHISPCGRVYVGITKLSLHDRWGNGGCKYKRCKLFYRAIQKYGWNKIIHEIILENVSKLEAVYTEKYLIKWYKSHGNSYNITDGGESTTGIHMPERAKRKISQYVKEHSGRRVLQYTVTGEFVKEYRSAIEASELLGYGHTSVSNCASGIKGKDSLHGYLFIYKDESDLLEQRLERCSRYFDKYKIVQYKGSDLVNEFESIREAARVTGINRLCISRNIRSKSRMAGGYVWRKIKII